MKKGDIYPYIAEPDPAKWGEISILPPRRYLTNYHAPNTSISINTATRYQQTTPINPYTQQTQMDERLERMEEMLEKFMAAQLVHEEYRQAFVEQKRVNHELKEAIQAIRTQVSNLNTPHPQAGEISEAECRSEREDCQAVTLRNNKVVDMGVRQEAEEESVEKQTGDKDDDKCEDVVINQAQDHRKNKKKKEQKVDVETANQE